MAIAHGTLDPVIPVDWGRAARDLLVAAGADVAYHESLVPHTIDPEIIPALRGFLAASSTPSNSLLLGSRARMMRSQSRATRSARVGLNDVPAGTARDRVAGTVAGENGVVAGTAEETIGTDTAHERVGAAEGVEDVAAAEPEQAVRPVRAAECVPPGGAPAYRPLYRLRAARRG